MPLHCPRRRSAQDEENQAGVRGRRHRRVACLLLALPTAALLLAGCKPAERAPLPPRSQPQMPPAPAEPTAVLPAPSAPATPKAVSEPKAVPETSGGTAPLTVTLAATNSGRHVGVGSGVTLTAFTTPTRGQSATLTLFYQRGRGRKTVFSFAQGSLCSTTWIAPAPGRYRFTAAALDDRRRAAVSRSVEITVDRPATQARPQIAAAPPFPAIKSVAARPSQPRTPRAAKRLAVTRPPVRPPVYHVVAAHFALRRNADVLATALRKNGYHAAARRMVDGRGKSVYIVETGAYRQPGEVFEAVAQLLRSGYPAYFYTGD